MTTIRPRNSALIAVALTGFVRVKLTVAFKTTCNSFANSSSGEAPSCGLSTSYRFPSICIESNLVERPLDPGPGDGAREPGAEPGLEPGRDPALDAGLDPKSGICGEVIKLLGGHAVFI